MNICRFFLKIGRRFLYEDYFKRGRMNLFVYYEKFSCQVPWFARPRLSTWRSHIRRASQALICLICRIVYRQKYHRHIENSPIQAHLKLFYVLLIDFFSDLHLSSLRGWATLCITPLNFCSSSTFPIMIWSGSPAHAVKLYSHALLGLPRDLSSDSVPCTGCFSRSCFPMMSPN